MAKFRGIQKNYTCTTNIIEHIVITYTDINMALASAVMAGVAVWGVTATAATPLDG